MNLIELDRALKQLRLGGMAEVLGTRLHQAQAESMAPIDLLSCLVSDELNRRGERLLERRRKQAAFRDSQKTLDNFDFDFNKKMNRSLVFDLATGAPSSGGVRTGFSSGLRGVESLTWRKPSGKLSFNRAIVFSIVKHTRCSTILRKRHWTARGKSGWSSWKPCPC